MKFFINKYPVKNAVQDGDKYKDIPEGTAFQIDGINGNMLELKPVKNIGETMNTMVDASMLQIAFYESEFTD